MTIEQRLRRLMQLVRRLSSKKRRRTGSVQALKDLRALGDWLYEPPAYTWTRPDPLERALSRMATSIFRRRRRGSRRRIVVRLQRMRGKLGLALYPNRILLHPDLCDRPQQLVRALCHEIAHLTRGTEFEHDEVFALEMSTLRQMYGDRIMRDVARALRYLEPLL